MTPSKIHDTLNLNMDKTTLFNQALSLIGAGRYQQGSGVQSPCELWLPLVLREATVRHNWSFARRVTTITPEADGTYHLPADCMNPLYFRDPTTGALPARYIVIGRHIHTDHTGPARLIYQSDAIATHQELPDSSPEFCTAVAYLLAARISRECTGTHDAAAHCEQMAEIQFEKAITRDAQADASNKADPLSTADSPPWLDERYY